MCDQFVSSVFWRDIPDPQQFENDQILLDMKRRKLICKGKTSHPIVDGANRVNKDAFWHLNQTTV